MLDAATILESESRELIRRRGLDVHGDQLEPLIREVAADYDRRASSGSVPVVRDLDPLIAEVAARIGGFGPLQEMLDDPTVEEIWLNSPSQVFVARNGRSELTPLVLTDDEVRGIVERMLVSSGRRLDMSSPFVDALLPDGSRLHCVIPAVTRSHFAVNIRKFVAKAHDLADMVALGSLTPQAAAFLDAAVASGLNVVVSGATGAGKTTFLRCLAQSVGPRERVVTIEEVFELDLGLRDVVAMQTRQANLEGTGEISMRRLVKEALRMRPTRIIVGEVREAEALDMLIALNSGFACIVKVQRKGGTYDSRGYLLPDQSGQVGRRARRGTSGEGLQGAGGSAGFRSRACVRRRRRVGLQREAPAAVPRDAGCPRGGRVRGGAVLAHGPVASVTC